MEDPELAAIRAARIQQLKQQGGSSSPSAGRPAPSGEGEDGAQRAAEEEMRRNLLATVLDSSARERLSRISLVSPERSRQIESILLRMAQTGQLKSKVTEDQLIGLLEQAEEARGAQKKSTIVFQRRPELDDDDDFDL